MTNIIVLDRTIVRPPVTLPGSTLSVAESSRPRVEVPNADGLQVRSFRERFDKHVARKACT